MARLTALAPDGVGPISPGPRSAWGEFREDPVLFARSRPQVLLIPLVFVVFVGALGMGGARLEHPGLSRARAQHGGLGALRAGVRSGLYLANFWVTLYEALMGFVIAAVSGIMLGAVIAQFRVVERTFYPYLVALQTLPKIAIAPLVIVWFGFGISSKVIIAATVAFFPVLVNVIVGLKTIDPAKLDLMRSLRASRWQTFRLVTFPNALPFVFAGLDIAIVFSVLGRHRGRIRGGAAGARAT